MPTLLRHFIYLIALFLLTISPTLLLQSTNMAMAQGNSGSTKNSGLSMSDISKRLTSQGYKNVKVLDGTLPGLSFNACKNGKQKRVGVSKWGDILWENTGGKC